MKISNKILVVALATAPHLFVNGDRPIPSPFPAAEPPLTPPETPAHQPPSLSRATMAEAIARKRNPRLRSTSGFQVSVLVKTYRDSAQTEDPHPLSIVSPEASAAGNVAFLTLSGSPGEPFFPSPEDESCTLCDRFFGAGATLISSETPQDAYDRGTFVFDPASGFYRAIIRGPPFPGVYTLVWKNANKDRKVAAMVEVACSDGVHCNGEERFIRDVCVPGYSVALGMGRTPYFFGPNNEQVHQCHESAPWANPVAVGSDAGECGPTCVPKCRKGQKCGSGGCLLCPVESGPCVDPVFANFCGICNAEAGEVCVDGACIVREGPSDKLGTCNNPLNLLSGLVLADGLVFSSESHVVPAEGIVGYFTNNGPILDTAEDSVTPACNVPGSPELIYKFVLEQDMGFEVMVTGAFPTDDLDTIYGGYTGSVDPLVAVHGESELGCPILDAPTGADYYCSDDSTPPGSLGSRIAGLLKAGSYTIIVSSYSANSFGPHHVFVKFTGNQNRPTACAGAFCGPDSAGGSCGLFHYFGVQECATVGETCLLGRCSNCDPSYVSDCAGDQCGFDQCNFPCGKYEGGCPNKRKCNLLTRQCKPVTSCNSLIPDCSGLDVGNGVKSKRYCGSDCQLYRVNDKLPDLVAPTELEVKSRLFFQKKIFTPEHCGVQEGSVEMPEGINPGEEFVKRMMFFDTNTHNLGESFKPPAREKRPDLFVWGDCHGHDHFLQFAKFSLRTVGGNAATDDRFTKLAYCMEDSKAYMSGPYIPCSANGICEDQSISSGWSDNYYSDLDGQWIDVSTIQAGWYVYEVTINYARVFHERSFENNSMRMLVYVDPQYICNLVLNYCDMIGQTEACKEVPQPLPMGVSFPPECLSGHPLFCSGGNAMACQ